MALSVKDRFDRTFRPVEHQRKLSERQKRQEYLIRVENTLDAWLKHDVGAYFQECIEREANAAMAEMATIPPNSPENCRRIQELQNTVANVRSINRWIVQLQLQTNVIK